MGKIQMKKGKGTRQVCIKMCFAEHYVLKVSSQLIEPISNLIC